MRTIKTIADLVDIVNVDNQDIIRESLSKFLSAVATLKEQGVDPSSLVLLWTGDPDI